MANNKSKPPVYPDIKPHHLRPFIFIAIVCFAVLVGLFYILGNKADKTQDESEVQIGIDVLQEGISEKTQDEDERQIVTDLIQEGTLVRHDPPTEAFPLLVANVPLKQFSGVIKSIGDQFIVISFHKARYNPSDEGFIDKTIRVAEHTTLGRRVTSSAEVNGKSSDEPPPPLPTILDPSVELLDEFPLPPPPPDIQMESLSFSELKVGDVVSIETVADAMASNDLEAVSIHIAPPPLPPPPQFFDTE